VTVVETLLVYVGGPLAVVVLLALLTYLPGARKRRARYKPGQPWEHEPIWWEPHAASGEHGSGHDGSHALTAGTSASARPYGGARVTW
jgi:hypothetical protein